MGEKYDCYWDYGYEPLRITPLARFRDPSGGDFPAAQFGLMRQGGPAGLQALGDYLGRPASSIEQMCNECASTINSAGDSSDDKLAAGRSVVERMTTGFADLQRLGAQGDMTLQMLDREGTVPSADLSRTALASTRAVKKSAVANVGLLDQLIDTVFNQVQDSALNAMGAQAEAAVNRVGQFAYSLPSGVYRRMARQGPGDGPSGQGA